MRTGYTCATKVSLDTAADSGDCTVERARVGRRRRRAARGSAGAFRPDAGDAPAHDAGQCLRLQWLRREPARRRWCRSGRVGQEPVSGPADDRDLRPPQPQSDVQLRRRHRRPLLSRVGSVGHDRQVRANRPRYAIGRANALQRQPVGPGTRPFTSSGKRSARRARSKAKPRCPTRTGPRRSAARRTTWAPRSVWSASRGGPASQWATRRA